MEQSTSTKKQEYFTITMTSEEACSILSHLRHLPDGPLSYSQAVTDFYGCLSEAYKEAGNVR